MIREHVRRSFGIGAMASDIDDRGYGKLGAFVDVLGSTMTAAGVTMNRERALQISTVSAAVLHVTETLATLPLKTYRQTNDTKEEAKDHPLYRILQVRPNPDHTAAELRALLMEDVELDGNGVAVKVTIGGEVEELLYVEADRVQRLERMGEVRYRIDRGVGESALLLTPDQVLHLRGPFGRAGWAASPCDQYRELFGLAWALEAYVAWSFANGAKVGGVLESPNLLSPAARKNLVEFMKQYEGVRGRKTMLLEEGLKYSKTAQTHDEAQVVELQEKVDAKMARVFRVPLHLLASHIAQPRANMEQQGQEFVSLSLRSRAVRIEQRIAHSCLPLSGEYYCEHLFDALERGDLMARVNAYVQMITNGVMSPNEVRRKENLNPRPGGDEFIRPLNMGPANAATPERPSGAQRDGASSQAAAERLEEALRRLVRDGEAGTHTS